MTIGLQESIEAWIDVGGTFTDCYVRHSNGALSRLKTLSSGFVPISLDPNRSGSEVKAEELGGDPLGFWDGAKLHGFDVNGQATATVHVIRFADGLLRLSGPLPEPSVSAHLDLGIEAPVLAVRRQLRLPVDVPLPPLRIRLGTTKGTNALLTRQGARTALAITSPFEDLLSIGDQTRPDLFALSIEKAPPLAVKTIGILERLDSQGAVARPLDVAHARQQFQRLLDEGIESLAICLMHSYLNPAHEVELAQVAREIGFTQISCSSHIAPLIEIVARAQTTVVDAYLSPIVRSYLRKLIEQFGDTKSVQMHVMTSAGGLIEWQQYSGKDSILSGPAGGVAALRGIASAVRQPKLIGLDMGGTSTDVSRVSPEHELQYESTKAGIRILTPTLPIETVAAGGGSVCWFDGVSLRVGPNSAGAEPGPACYGRGGPLTITDVNVWLGRIPEEQFPFPIDRPAIERCANELLREAGATLGFSTVHELAIGFRRLANAQMAEAVRTVSMAQGADPRSYALLGFGGAAGQHICEIAELLGVTEVYDSAEAGLLSALGMGLADQRLDAVIAVYTPAESVDWQELGKQAKAESLKLLAKLQEQGGAAERCSYRYWLETRYTNTDFTLAIPWETMELPPAVNYDAVRSAFDRLHRQRYGYARAMHTVELVALRIEAIARGSFELAAVAPDVEGTKILPQRMDKIRRDAMSPGGVWQGPCIVLNNGSTLVVERGWTACCLSEGSLRLTKMANELSKPLERAREVTREFDPIFRDCCAQRLSAIATQMGIVLQQTAVSVNVKQRRDYSCAIFDASGQLLANAPHVPVHLGAMGQTVREIISRFPGIRPGDSFITNDPYCGGSHLPDITVVTPVYQVQSDSGRPAAAQRLQLWVANRAHHADIGGLAPGSMSISAVRLGEEGVVIPPMHLTVAGEDNSEQLIALLRSAKYPPRNMLENLADIAAQQAANLRGIELLEEYAASTTWNRLQVAGEQLLSAAEERVRRFLVNRFTGMRTFRDYLDDGTAICVRLEFSETGGLIIDFDGSGVTSSTNFNANPSIVKAAVMYTLRCLIADELPLNEGVLRCVDLRIPAGILCPEAASVPEDSPAVVAGNVETSQRVVDVLLGALGIAAASQGTMNNLLFGNATFGFYETICGGAGAIEGKPGASGVHTHMTNTRLTDPEVLEARYPVRLVEFRLRTGSGGPGHWPGGQGVVRCIEFCQAVEVSLLTSRRGKYPPFGMQGGQPGQLGCNTLIRANGNRRILPGCCQLSVAAGERIELQTPGGGGFGAVDAPEIGMEADQ